MVENMLKDKPLPTGQVLENVGYSQTLAEQPSRIIEAPGFQEALAETGLKNALIAKGITPEKIAEKIDVLLEAKKPIYEEVDGEMQHVGDEVDFTAVDKGLKHATAIYGVLGDAKPPVTVQTYNFIFSPEVQAEVREMEAKIKARLVKPIEPPHVQTT